MAEWEEWKGKGEWMGKGAWKGKWGGWKGKPAWKGKAGGGKGKFKGKQNEGEVDADLPEGVRRETFPLHETLEGQVMHLDVYHAAAATEQDVLRPSVLYTHGTAFNAGQKLRNKPPFLDALSKRGYTVAVLEHRPKAVGFEAILHDGKAALRFLRGNARAMGLDPERISVFGDSSGGWMSLMLASTANPAVPREVDLDGHLGYPAFRALPVHVACCVDFYAPVNFLLSGQEHAPDSLASTLIGFPAHEQPEVTARMHPVTYIDGSLPPTLVVHGTEDERVPYFQSKHLVQKLQDVGAKHEYIELPGLGHGPPPAFRDEVMVRVLDWLDEHSST